MARQRWDPRTRFWLVVALAGAAFLAFWWLTRGASLTHDEVVYVDVAGHLLRSDYYPGDLFLRHPPLGIGLLGAWQTLGLPLRLWPVPWTLAGIGLTAAGLRERGGSPWALAALVASPATLALVSVTMYPPLVAFLGVAAYGWARGSRLVEAVGWNLGVLAHELALLALAFRLAPRAVAYAQDRAWDLGRLSRLVVPYPAAVAWGTLMLVGILQGTDPRGGVLSNAWDPSANALAVMRIKPLIGLLFAATLVPLARWPREASHPARGLTIAALVAVIGAPFYRYLVALLPMMIVMAGALAPRWIDRERWPIVAVTGALLAGGGALAATTQGIDTVNAADVPGLVDHADGVELIEPGETVIVRSPVSFAHVMREGGWRLESTGRTVPSELVLSQGEATVTLLRAETEASLRNLSASQDVDASLLPASWHGVIGSLRGDGWTQDGTAGHLVRLETPTGSPDRG